jgi:DNA replication protein DnaC
VKSLDSFDFTAIPSLNKTLVLELARCEYITRRENVIAVGNSGTGKTHIVLGLGLSACQKGLSVGFITTAAMVHELIEARDEKRLLRLQRQLATYKLLIIDELGYVPLSTTARSSCSRSSASVTSVPPLLSPAICRSTSGPAYSAPSG